MNAYNVDYATRPRSFFTFTLIQRGLVVVWLAKSSVPLFRRSNRSGAIINMPISCNVCGGWCVHIVAEYSRLMHRYYTVVSIAIDWTNLIRRRGINISKTVCPRLLLLFADWLATNHKFSVRESVVHAIKRRRRAPSIEQIVKYGHNNNNYHNNNNNTKSNDEESRDKRKTGQDNGQSSVVEQQGMGHRVHIIYL